MDAIILAAGMGKRLFPYTRNIPKCLLQVGTMSILERQILNLREVKVDNIYIVIGHKADNIRNTIGEFPDIHYIFNPNYNNSNVIMSLMMALPYVQSSYFCFCADCVFDAEVLNSLATAQAPVVLATTQKAAYDTEAMRVNIQQGTVVSIGRKIENTLTNGEYIGLAAINNRGVSLLKQQVLAAIAAGKKDFFFGDVINSLICNYSLPVASVDMTGKKWGEIDYEDDLLKARELFADEEVLKVDSECS